MKLNVNTRCTITLLPRGIEAINEHYEALRLEPPKYSVGDEYTAPLWDIMHVFGSHTYMGPQAPFETTIEVHDNDIITGRRRRSRA